MIKATDTSTTDHPELTLVIDNGDLQGLKDALSSYNFKDYEALIRYALFAMLSSQDNNLYVRGDDGGIAKIVPNNEIVLKHKDEEKTDVDEEPQE
jgi:hypothetical protein